MCTCGFLILFSGYLVFLLLFHQLLCAENFLTSWFIGLHKHHTNPNSMWADLLFSLRPSLFRPLVPPTELCRRLWGQQIHCSEGATSESNLFDLTMALVSNKLTSNRGYLVWLGVVHTGIINWPNSVFMGKLCVLSVLKLFLEVKRAVQGSCLKLLWLSTQMMNLKQNYFFNEHIAEVVFFFFHFKSSLFLI